MLQIDSVFFSISELKCGLKCPERTMKGTIMMMMCEIGPDSHHLVTGARVCWGTIMMPGMVSDVI